MQFNWFEPNMVSIHQVYSEMHQEQTHAQTNYIRVNVGSIQVRLRSEENTAVDNSDEDEYNNKQPVEGEVNVGFAVPGLAGQKRKSEEQLPAVKSQQEGWFTPKQEPQQGSFGGDVEMGGVGPETSNQSIKKDKESHPKSILHQPLEADPP